MSPSWRYMLAYCATCGRWSALDLERMVRDGHGSRRVPIRIHYQSCGEPGECEVRVLMPGSVGYQRIADTVARVVACRVRR